MTSLRFVAVLFAVTVVASVADRLNPKPYGFVFGGVAAGLFGFLGVMYGLADETQAKRLRTAAAGAFAISLVFVFRPQFNPWELLLSMCRLFFLGAYFSWVRQFRECLFKKDTDSPPIEEGKLELSSLFGFTLLVAVYLALIRLLKSDSSFGGDAFVIVVVLLVGLFAALVPMIAASAALRKRSWTSAMPYAIASAALAFCMGVFSYSQTDNLDAGIGWTATSIVEASVVSLAILVLRRRGYRLISVRSAYIKQSVST